MPVLHLQAPGPAVDVGVVGHRLPVQIAARVQAVDKSTAVVVAPAVVPFPESVTSGTLVFLRHCERLDRALERRGEGFIDRSAR